MESETVMPEEREKREFVQRIADSPAFRGAPRLREFLLFVTERALSDRLDDISEQRIGHEVFRRPVDYDTANDNIVRVSARQVRMKLKEYAEGDGRDEPWVLEIPKGAYIPVFTPRALPEKTAASSPPVAAAPPPGVPAPDRTRVWKLTALGCALLALVLGAALVRNTAMVVPAGAPRAAAPLTDLVIRPGQRTLIVLADSSLVLLHELTGQVVNAEDYASRRYPPVPGGRSTDSASPAFARILAARQLTSVADVGFAIRILRLRPDAAERLVVVHARNVGPRNLKENNVILIGGPRSNPWTGLFEDRLSFRFDFSGERAWARILNARPQPGEPPVYETEGRDGTATRAFARIALVPNLDHTGRVLLIAGTTIEATEAAAEFFLDGQAGQSLTGVLGRQPSEGNGFEVLLETTAIGGTARNSRIIAHRLLP
jgi:hypothetical protein